MTYLLVFCLISLAYLTPGRVLYGMAQRRVPALREQPQAVQFLSVALWPFTMIAAHISGR